MDALPIVGFTETISHLVGEMARAVCVRAGESQHQMLFRLQVATQMILGLHPRDVIETMLAGHCVMLHEIMTDDVRMSLSGQPDDERRATRAAVVAEVRAFNANLGRLQRYQTRLSQGQRDAPTKPAAAGPEPVEAVGTKDQAPAPGMAAPTPEPQAASGPKQGEATGTRAPAPGIVAAPPVRTASPQDHRAELPAVAPAQRTPAPATATSQSTPAPAKAQSTPVPATPSKNPSAPHPASTAAAARLFNLDAAYLAACSANTGAMAALKAGDPASFARAMGQVPASIPPQGQVPASIPPPGQVPASIPPPGQVPASIPPPGQVPPSVASAADGEPAAADDREKKAKSLVG